MLWVLIRSSNEYPQNMFLWRHKKKYLPDTQSYLDLRAKAGYYEAVEVGMGHFGLHITLFFFFVFFLSPAHTQTFSY